PATDSKLVNRVVSLDGVTHDAALAGRSFPGPLLRGDIGDHFQINGMDELCNESMATALSIHSHGLLLHTANRAVGAAFVTYGIWELVLARL
ncbi:hypothetical protein DICSQDRAFT_67806, partial [Dichomitus squalens LYAD-421 SS1]